MNDLIVIPQLKHSIIASIKNDTITEIGEVNVPIKSKSIITENKLIVSLCYDSKTLKIHNIDGDLLFKKEDSKHKAINFRNNIVYLGGEYDICFDRDSFNQGEMFSVMNLNKIDFKINSMDLPIKIIDGKSIDDILINGNELLLVDNIIYPKYLMIYDISSPVTPIHIETIKLPNNGTYEHIIKGDMNNDWLILYSSTIGMGGSYEYITINGKTNGHLHTYSPLFSFEEDNSMKTSAESSFLDIALIKNNLFVLKTDGLFSINLNNEISNKNLKLIKKSNIKRIIKSKNMNLIAIYEDGYEIIE